MSQRIALFVMFLVAGGAHALTPPLHVAITSVAPPIVPPSGGTVVSISGTNFTTPLRVFFRMGSERRESFIVAATFTRLDVVAPAFDLGTQQQKRADVIVTAFAGTSIEESATSPNALSYQLDVLTPRITALSPNSGPGVGGTRVTIFGEGFQSPMQVFAGDREMRILSVSFDEIVAITPSGSDGERVPMRVVNPVTGKSATLDNAFSFIARMSIIAAYPTSGASHGGTRVTIEGVGFFDPVSVVIGGVAAQPILVTPARIIAITSPVAAQSCSDLAGPIQITNIDNGDTAFGPSFTYTARPLFLATPQSAVEGETFNVVLDNAGESALFTIGGRRAAIVATSVVNGTSTFKLRVPQFASRSCGGAKTLTTTLTFVDLAGGCSVSTPLVIERAERESCDARPQS